MATSGTFAWTLDIDEVIQEAIEGIGSEHTLGNEPKSARRSINLLLQDWQNREILLWATSIATVSVSTSVGEYALTSSTIDVLEVVLATSSSDIPLDRITMEEYLQIPNKTRTGRPTQYAVRRSRNNISIFLWPLPDSNNYDLKMEKFRYLEDVNKSALQHADVPRRFLPALTAGLSYFMVWKRPGIEGGRIQALEVEYEKRLARAMGEDKDRTNMRIVPKLNLV